MKMLTRAEVMEQTGVCKEWLYKRIKDGTLKEGTHWRRDGSHVTAPYLFSKVAITAIQRELRRANPNDWGDPRVGDRGGAVRVVMDSSLREWLDSLPVPPHLKRVRGGKGGKNAAAYHVRKILAAARTDGYKG